MGACRECVGGVNDRSVVRVKGWNLGVSTSGVESLDPRWVGEGKFEPGTRRGVPAGAWSFH